jgi:hypothetical protein
MNNHQPTASIVNRSLSLIGVSVMCYAILWASPVTFFSRLFSFEHSYFFLQFERHFWQYLFAFVTVIILSRGHLWSYGINSQNLKTSMVWLSWLYAVTAVLTLLWILAGNELLPTDVANIPGGTNHTIILLLVFWMSSPVANQILFFSFGQSVLMKQWGDSMKIAGIPVVVLFSALLFTFGATTSQFSVGPVSPVLTFALGLFCGTVYWKTNSLITPMLGQAFYFGLPLFIHILRSAIFS